MPRIGQSFSSDDVPEKSGLNSMVKLLPEPPPVMIAQAFLKPFLYLERPVPNINALIRNTEPLLLVHVGSSERTGTNLSEKNRYGGRENRLG